MHVNFPKSFEKKLPFDKCTPFASIYQLFYIPSGRYSYRLTLMRNNKKSLILAAALEVVESEGANHLTLDAVAKKAGFSKGGVLYHFSTKTDLLKGMVNYLIETNDTKLLKRKTGEKLIAAIVQQENQMTTQERRASFALVAAASEDEELLEPARKYYSQLFREVTRNSPSSNEAVLLLLAIEGMRWLNILDLSPLSKDETKDIRQLLKQRAAEN